MSDIATPATGSPPVSSRTGEVLAPASTTDNPSAEQQAGQNSNQRPAQTAPAPPPRGHDPAVVLPASLAGLADGNVLALQVALKDPQGRYILHSDKGIFAAALPDTIPLDGQLKVQIQGMATTITAAIIEIDGIAQKQPVFIDMALVRLAEGTTPATVIEALSAAPVVAEQAPGGTAYRPASPLPANPAPPDDTTVSILTAALTASRSGAPQVVPVPGTVPPAPPATVTAQLPEGGALFVPGTALVIALQSATGGAEALASSPGLPVVPPVAIPAGLIDDGLPFEGVVAGEMLERAAQVAGQLAGTTANPGTGDSEDQGRPVLLQTNIGLLKTIVPESVAVGNRVSGTVIAASAHLSGPRTTPAATPAVDPSPTVGTPPSVGTPLKPATEVLAVATIPVEGSSQPLPPAPFSPLQWPAAEAAVQAAAAAQAATVAATMAATAATTAATPSPHQVTSPDNTLRFLLAALRLGDARALVGGNALDALEKNGARDILRQLHDDVAKLGRLAAGPATAADGRAIVLPVFDNGQYQPILLYLFALPNAGDGHPGSPDDAPQPEEEGPSDNRFLVDLNLTRLGRMQFEGHLQDGRLAMIIRHGAALSVSDRQAIGKIFDAANGVSDITGSVVFDEMGRAHV